MSTAKIAVVGLGYVGLPLAVALARHGPVTGYATVNGKNYWRVAATGFDADAARSMCGSIKSRGGACLAYASSNPVPSDRGGPQVARR